MPHHWPREVETPAVASFGSTAQETNTIENLPRWLRSVVRHSLEKGNVLAIAIPEAMAYLKKYRGSRRSCFVFSKDLHS